VKPFFGIGTGYVRESALKNRETASMKKLFLASILLAAALTASPAFAEDQRNVTVVNGTGYGIKFLGFNNPGDNDWSENELPPNSVLPDGNSVYVKFNTADSGCKWNFKIEWADAGYPGVVWNDLDLCRVTTVTLKYDRSSDTTTAEVK
jgi:hypothetical protein